MKIPVEEALRYIGAAKADAETRRLAEETAGMLEARLQPGFTWRAFRTERTEAGIFLPEAGFALPGSLAEKMLADCDTAALLVCTLGAGFERLEKEWEKRDMARAAVMDACGSAWTETVCDEAEEEIRARFPDRWLTDRFSPGYGDLPLSLQADILRATDAGRKLGVTANESFLLLPCKSVTAVIGLADRPQGAKIRGCAYCAIREDCAFRKGGKFCGA